MVCGTCYQASAWCVCATGCQDSSWCVPPVTRVVYDVWPVSRLVHGACRLLPGHFVSLYVYMFIRIMFLWFRLGYIHDAHWLEPSYHRGIDFSDLCVLSVCLSQSFYLCCRQFCQHATTLPDCDRYPGFIGDRGGPVIIIPARRTANCCNVALHSMTSLSHPICFQR